MDAIGLLSWMVAASAPPAWTGAPRGMAASVLGAMPNEHVSTAPAVTWIATPKVCVRSDGAARGSRPVVGATVSAREGNDPFGVPKYRGPAPTAGVSNVVGLGDRSGYELHCRWPGLRPPARDDDARRPLLGHPVGRLPR